MRMALTLITFFCASAAQAWVYDGRADCSVRHQTDKLGILLSYAPQTGLYSIAITRWDKAWAGGNRFSMKFDGPKPIFITTDRHELAQNKTTVIASDTGFGNVLDGLEFNFVAAAQLGRERVTIPLKGAKSEIAKFRECAEDTAT